MSECADCKELEYTLELIGKAVYRATSLWQKNTGKTDVLPDTAKLITWLIAQREEYKTKSEFLNNVVKGEQARCNQLVEDKDRMVLNNEALAEVNDRAHEEIEQLLAEKYYFKQDISDLLAALPSHVARCERCEKFKINVGECEHCSHEG